MTVRAWIFLAMACWQLGEQDTARTWHEKAADWLKQVGEPNNTHLQRVQAEATSLLGDL